LSPSPNHRAQLIMRTSVHDNADENGYSSGNLDVSLTQDTMGNVRIPSTGISISDKMEDTTRRRERFQTTLYPIVDDETIVASMSSMSASNSVTSRPRRVGAQLVTSTLFSDSCEPVRYLVALNDLSESRSPSTDTRYYALVDVPPFSMQLVQDIRNFIGESGKLACILVTNKESIHYDDSPGVYAFRKSALKLWTETFPQISVVGYRLDIPRDCRAYFTQVLDGYGPFAATVIPNMTEQLPHVSFVETGRKLTVAEWDREIANEILNKGRKPPDEVEQGENDQSIDSSDDYSGEAIRQREDGHDILAIFTPGHTFGSVSYVFPRFGVCCSGFTLPLEDRNERPVAITDAEEDDDDDDDVRDTLLPSLDFRGYLTTSAAGMVKQMQSAQILVDRYSDRFHIVCPARGNPLHLNDVIANTQLNNVSKIEQRRQTLTRLIGQYQRLGEIYNQLGISST
jgi:hypothetical protein